MSVVKPRGRKPAAVYWRRRIVVLAVAAGLVFAVTRWVGGGDDAAAEGSRPAASSAQRAAGDTPSGGASAKQQPRTRKQTQKAKQRQAKRKAAQQPAEQVTTTLRAPQGRCAPTEVVVVPDVVDSAALRPVPLRLGFSTTADRACTLELSGKDLALEVTSGDDLIWRLSSCPQVFARQELVLRPGWVSYTDVAWNGRRGDDTCADTNEFAEPGYYWAEAAVLGGEPARGQFKLQEPPPPPKADRDRGDEKDQDGRDQQKENRQDGNPQDGNPHQDADQEDADQEDAAGR